MPITAHLGRIFRDEGVTPANVVTLSLSLTVAFASAVGVCHPVDSRIMPQYNAPVREVNTSPLDAAAECDLQHLMSRCERLRSRASPSHGRSVLP